MVPPGGSATLYGVLYQLLASVHRAVRLRVFQGPDKSVEGARLQIEPLRGGGDLRIEMPDRRIVEQLKARTDGRRWGLREVGSKVLPDLYLDAALDLPDDQTEYIFSTEGLVGPEAHAFFQRLRDPQPQGDPLADLHSEDREDFLYIADAVRKRKDIRSEAEADTHRKLRRLISRLTIRDRQTAGWLIDEIDRMLLPLLDHREDLGDTRDKLCMMILRKGTGEDREFTPADLLREAGLSAVSLEDLPELRRTARELLEREVTRRERFNPNQDVHPGLEWPEGRWFLDLSREKHRGKTWQISHLAVDLARRENGPFIVFLRSTGDAIRDLQKVSDLLWTEAWRHDRTLPLHRLADRWKESHGETGQPWLVTCVDGLQTARQAQDLIDAFAWKHWGIGLAITVAETSAEELRFADEWPEQTQLPTSKSFTSRELREFLRRHGHSLGAVPSDIRETLKQPLLAQIYVTTVASDPHWEPKREYELYEGYWRRLERLSGPEDLVRLKRLAQTLLDPEPVYPWTREQLEQAQVTDEARLRLEEAGWWTCKDDRYEVWHDRLVSWALAEAIAPKGTRQVLANRLIACLSSQIPRVGRILAYVPMDVLWLLLRHPIRQGMVPDLIARLEQDNAFEQRDLYHNLLPTLGPEIIPGLIQRLRSIPEDMSFHFTVLAAKTLSTILTKGSSVLVPISDLLEEEGVLRKIAIKVLTRHPSPAATVPLWEIHKGNALALEESHEIENYTSREDSFAALRACLDLDPVWLRSKILEADPAIDPTWELAYLLANLKHQEARSIWMKRKGTLFQKMPPNKRRSLVVCIRIFDDREEISRLESWLSIEEDWIGDYAFRALAWVAPERAVALLQTLPLDNLSNDHAGSWPVVLLAGRLDETRSALRKRMAQAGPDFWKVADLYTWYEELIDRESMDLMLDRLAQDVADLTGPSEKARDRLWRPIRLLSKIYRLDLLQAFEKRAGTDLDRTLGKLGVSWSQHDLKEVRSVLLKIGGEGFRRLIREGLASSDRYDRRVALAWGMACPEEVAATDPHEAWVLAALGKDQNLVRELLAFEEEIDNRGLMNLWRLRRWKPPMTDADLAPAFEALASGDARARIRGLAAVSISARSDLLARLPEWLDRAGDESQQELDDRAAFLVHRLAEGNPDGVRHLSRNLDPQRFPGTWAELLGKPGAEEIPGLVEQHLLLQIRQGWFEAAEMQLALSLTKHVPQLDPSVLRAVWSYGKDNFHWNREVFWTTVVPLESEEVQEEVWKISLEHGFHDERSEGIAALALLAPQDAFETAAQHLSMTGKGRADFVWLLMDLDAKRAVPLLMEQAVRERETEVLWGIARVFRRAGRVVELQLRERLESPDYQRRKSAAELAGWQGPHFLQRELQKLAENDPDRDVQWECLWALDRQREEHCVLELMDAFRRAEGIARWSYLEAILELGDPRLLVTESDPLWLGRILASDLGRLEVHAHSRLKERFQEIKRKAERLDRDQED